MSRWRGPDLAERIGSDGPGSFWALAMRAGVAKIGT